MKKFFVFFLVVSLLSFLVVPKLVHAEPQSRSISNGAKVWIEAGEIVSADVYKSDASCGNRGEKLCDDLENTFCVFQVNERAYFEFTWGGTVWSQTTVSNVESDIKRYHPNWTRDQTTTVWPRGSSSQPGSTDWPLGIWKQLYPSQFLVVQSGITYYNFTSQSQYTNSISITKHTTITTTTTVWVWTTVSAKIHTIDPGYEKITLTPPTNAQNEQYTETLLYAGQRVTGWIWVYDSSRSEWIQQWDSHCENPLFFVNQSGTTIKIRYEKNGVSKKKVTIYNADYPTNENLRIQYGTELRIDWRLITVKYFQYF